MYVRVLGVCAREGSLHMFLGEKKVFCPLTLEKNKVASCYFLVLQARNTPKSVPNEIYAQFSTSRGIWFFLELPKKKFFFMFFGIWKIKIFEFLGEDLTSILLATPVTYELTSILCIVWL